MRMSRLGRERRRRRLIASDDEEDDDFAPTPQIPSQNPRIIISSSLNPLVISDDDDDDGIRPVPQPQPSSYASTSSFAPPNRIANGNADGGRGDREGIEERLRLLGLRLRSDWIDSCVTAFEGRASDVEGKAKYCFRRFLSEDMNVCGAGVLPADLDSLHNAELEGPFVLQVDEIVNISLPLRDRYQKAHPGPKRCLKLSMSDGVRHVFALEYRPIKDLDALSPAGLKVVIHNVVVRHGLLMLVPEIFKILGGVAEDLDLARQRLVLEINKPYRGKRKESPACSLSERASRAAWPSSNAVDRSNQMDSLALDERRSSHGNPLYSSGEPGLSSEEATHMEVGNGNGEEANAQFNYSFPRTLQRSASPTTEFNSSVPRTLHISDSTHINRATGDLATSRNQELGLYSEAATHLEVGNGNVQETNAEFNFSVPITLQRSALPTTEFYSSVPRTLHISDTTPINRAFADLATSRNQNLFDSNRMHVSEVAVPPAAILNNELPKSDNSIGSFINKFSASSLEGVEVNDHISSGDLTMEQISRTSGSISGHCSTPTVAYGAEELNLVEDPTEPVILTSEMDVPFTYMTCLLARCDVMEGSTLPIQGKIKCLLTGVKKFQFKDRDTYELQVYVDDGSQIFEVIVDHLFVEKAIGYSPKVVDSGLKSIDEKTVLNMKETMKKFQRFLSNFEGIMTVEVKDRGSTPVALELTQGCSASDAQLLMSRLLTSTAPLSTT